MINIEDYIIKKRTEEVQTIIDRIPTGIGGIVTIILFLLSGILLLFGFLIEYPEKVSGPVSVTAEKAPVRLVANAPGKLKLLIKDNEVLTENSSIAYIENSANLLDVITVEKIITSLDPEVLYINPHSLKKPQAPIMGELSICYYSFISTLEKAGQYWISKPYEKRRKSQEIQLKSQIRLKEETNRQIEIREQSLKISGKNVLRDSILYRSATISEFEMDRSSVNYLGVVESTQAIIKDMTSLEMKIEETQQNVEFLRIEQDDFEQKLRMEFFTTLNDLKARIEQWKLTYVFMATTNGRVEYNNFWREDDFVTVGTPIFAIIPSDNNLFGQILLPSQGAGKVKVGQEVIIRLDDYPYLEFGSIKGSVRSISSLSNQIVEYTRKNNINTYLVTVELPQNLKTNYGEILDFKYEIKGVAEILIKKRKLIERLFGNLKYIVSKK